MSHRLPRPVRRGGAKPRVLLVDDHRPLVDRLSALLDDDFEIAGFATDGHQAIETVARTNPDLVVLDINMPGLDGFQTKRALERGGCRAPVVFLSMLTDDEHVSEAFRCGGRGYVVKSRIARDLPSALDHALLGRMFAPSLASLFRLAAAGGHAMLLYGDAISSLDGLASFFDLALRSGDATCAIVTEDLREGLAIRLEARGWNAEHKRLRIVDAQDALNQFMRNGRPDPARLAEIVTELEQYRRDAGEGTTPRLTIFGNMAMWLSVNGNPDAAIALENFWDTLTHHLPFFTVCGYAASCFQDQGPKLYVDACGAHWAVSHASDIAGY